MPREEIFCLREKFPVSGRNFLSQEEISCQRKKFPVTGRNSVPEEQISCLSVSGGEKAVPKVYAILVTGCRISGKTMHSVREETIGQHLSAVRNLSNTGERNSS